MIIDFEYSCNKYNKNNYENKNFFRTNCPKCNCKGYFHKHAYYLRNVIFLFKNIVTEKQLSILRIKCLSCNSTHAVLPYDIIPYKTINTGFILNLLIMIFISKLPIKEICAILKLSFQMFYQYKNNFLVFINEIVNFLRVFDKTTPPKLSKKVIIETISSIEYIQFLKEYLKYNGKSFFMKKFHNKTSLTVYFGMV